MFTTNSCEPTLPKSIHSKKREPASIVNQQPKVIIDTTTLINNTSTSTIESPINTLEEGAACSTRVPSTIMIAGSINTAATTKIKNNNAMTTKAHETIISIKNRVPIKSIRIERDYSLGDGIIRFSTEYPIELTGKISQQEFIHTMSEINKLMDYADRLTWRIIVENIMETLTIYVWPIFFSTHYQRAVKKLIEFIEEENSTIYYPQSLSISDPVKAAFLFIEINFYE